MAISLYSPIYNDKIVFGQFVYKAKSEVQTFSGGLNINTISNKPQVAGLLLKSYITNYLDRIPTLLKIGYSDLKYLVNKAKITNSFDLNGIIYCRLINNNATILSPTLIKNKILPTIYAPSFVKSQHSKTINGVSKSFVMKIDDVKVGVNMKLVNFVTSGTLNISAVRISVIPTYDSKQKMIINKTLKYLLVKQK